MQVSDKLIKPLTEAKYLNADNVSRYRCIMRIFFEHYEKLKYWLYQEEVYEEMIKDRSKILSTRNMTEQLSRSRTAMTLRQEMLKQQMTLTRLQLQKLTQQTRQPRRQTLNNL